MHMMPTMVVAEFDLAVTDLTFFAGSNCGRYVGAFECEPKRRDYASSHVVIPSGYAFKVAGGYG